MKKEMIGAKVEIRQSTTPEKGERPMVIPLNVPEGRSQAWLSVVGRLFVSIGQRDISQRIEDATKSPESITNANTAAIILQRISSAIETHDGAQIIRMAPDSAITNANLDAILAPEHIQEAIRTRIPQIKP